jgi:hypothetical protein
MLGNCVLTVKKVVPQGESSGATRNPSGEALLKEE